MDWSLRWALTEGVSDVLKFRGSYLSSDVRNRTNVLARPTGVNPTRTHAGLKSIPIEGADDWIAEIFYPTAGVFSPAASVGDTSSGFAALVLADGGVLVIHYGCDDRMDHPTPAGHQIAEAAFYDPASRQ
jgi:hypothetical protein